ncbi:MAG: UvrD-helicase domain-containing protein [Inhella sp.]
MSAAGYRIDGAPVAAERFYARACSPQGSVVVEACAGAGKTWMLVSRMLRALLEGAEPQQIVAITFTRKAAAEMRGRLDEWLDQLRAAAAKSACWPCSSGGWRPPRRKHWSPRCKAYRRACSKGAGRWRCIPSMPGLRSCFAGPR